MRTPTLAALALVAMATPALAEDAGASRQRLGVSLETNRTPAGTVFAFFNMRYEPWPGAALSPMIGIGSYPRGFWQRAAAESPSNSQNYEDGNAYKSELVLWFPGASDFQLGPFVRGALISNAAVYGLLVSGGMSFRYTLAEGAGPGIGLTLPVVGSAEDPLQGLSATLYWDWRL